jgi:hypothetical protein
MSWRKSKRWLKRASRPSAVMTRKWYTTLIECEIDPLDKTPVQIRPYKLAFEEQREAAKIIEQLLKEKAIARSHSDWAAPAFLVPKPNGGWRLVTDLRFFNQRCRDWKMPLPAIEDVFQNWAIRRFSASWTSQRAFGMCPSLQSRVNTRRLPFAILGSLNT